MKTLHTEQREIGRGGSLAVNRGIPGYDRVRVSNTCTTMVVVLTVLSPAGGGRALPEW